MGYNGEVQDTNWGITLMDFHFDPPQLTYVPDALAWLFTTYASYCNDEGELIAYTNGMRVFDAFHNTMQGGEIINENPFWYTQYVESDDRPSGFFSGGGAVMLNKPGTEDRISVISNEYTFDFENLDLFYYSENLNYGEIQYSENESEMFLVDSLILNDTLVSGKIASVRHGNGRDWWINTKDLFFDTLHTFLLDPSGIKLFKNNPTGRILEHSHNGQDKFSPLGNYYASLHRQNGDSSIMNIHLFKFDRCEASYDLLAIDTIFFKPAGGQGIEFDAEERFLYVSDGEFIFQYDLLNLSQFKESRKIVAVFDGTKYEDFWDITLGKMWLAPDKKIYGVSGANSNKYLLRMNSPSRKGNKCDVEQHVIETKTTIAPTIPNSPNYRLGPLKGSPCDTLDLDLVLESHWRWSVNTIDDNKIEYIDLSYIEPEEWEWDFGDNTKSFYHSPIKTYQTGGVYNVCLTVKREEKSSTTCKELIIGMTDLEDVINDIEYRLFPNPATSHLNLDFYNVDPLDWEASIYDSRGVLVNSYLCNRRSKVFDVQSLSPGLYFLFITNNKKPLLRKTFIKME